LFRAFGKYDDPVTPEWESGVEKHGEETWKEMICGNGNEKKDVYSKAGPALMMFEDGVPSISQELVNAYRGKLSGEYKIRGAS